LRFTTNFSSLMKPAVLDDLVEDVANARVWGGLHFRTTITQTAKHFPQIARDIGKHYFLEKQKDGD